MIEFEEEFNNCLHFGYIPNEQQNKIIEHFKDWQPPKPLVVVPELTQKQEDTLNDYKNGSGSLVNYLSTEIKKGDYDYFARAWLDGYTVEKEQLYEIRLPLPNGNYASIDFKGYIWGEVIPNKCKLTESEVKNIDERYWAFAVPV